jgi:precorrin-2 C20-methyltransferase/precorrin-3B C17-methyltransferase
MRQENAGQARPGRLYGVGVGPGDPELVTVRAARLIGAADVIAFPVAPRAGATGVARRIALPHMRPGVLEEPLVYPVTTEETAHPGGYEGAIAAFYDESAARLAAHLDAGRDVVVLCEGDPFFYGSYMYLHDRLAHRYATEVVPGVTSFSAAAAAAGTPLVRRDDVLTVLPATLSEDELATRLRAADAAVVMKLGRTFPGVVAAASRAEVAERAVFVAHASGPGQRVAPLTAVDPSEVPYMSLVLVPTPEDRRTGAGAARAGRVAVVGLGPGGAEWRTPEAQAELAEADVVVGYSTYVRRVPHRRGQRRLESDNRVELDRAREALELAARGERVAVVSSGDPGIFAMAAAVFEAVEVADGAFDAVDVRVVPGLSAMQAAAARVGAPLGHDFAVISLSDIRKPWPVIERRLAAVAGADMAVALYNPASTQRREQLERALGVLAAHRAPETPVVVARAVGSDAESVTVAALGTLDPAVVDMRTLLIVGASTTRVLPGSGQVYTARSYPAA